MTYTETILDNHFIILGGGISGLSAGWKIASHGFPVTVLEASKQIGGLAGTVREDNYFLDYGPHSFFSDDIEIKNLILDLFHPPLDRAPRSSAFFFQGRYLDYPLSAASVLFQMGLASGIQAAWSFFSHKIFSSRGESLADQDMTVEEWATKNFGPYLYKTFFKPYTEQFWKISCRELSSRSIPSHTRTGFMRTLKLLLTKKNTAKNPTQIERETLPTYYPPSGYGAIPEKVADLFLTEGGKLQIGCKVTRIEKIENGYSVFYEGPNGREEIRASHVISTLPLCVFLPMIHPAPPAEVLASAKQLDYRPLVNLGMVIERQNVLPCAYFYTLDRPYNRLTEMNQFSSATSPENENIIAAEIPCLRHESLWTMSKEKLFEHCIGALERDGIFARHEVKRLLVAKAPYAYPIYLAGFKNHLDRVMNFLRECPHLYTLGRSGEFHYMDLDQCVRRAVDLSKKITGTLQPAGALS